MPLILIALRCIIIFHLYTATSKLPIEKNIRYASGINMLQALEQYCFYGTQPIPLVPLQSCFLQLSSRCHPQSSPRPRSTQTLAKVIQPRACLAASSQGGSKHCLLRSWLCHLGGSQQSCASWPVAMATLVCADLAESSRGGWCSFRPCSSVCHLAGSLCRLMSKPWTNHMLHNVAESF